MQLLIKGLKVTEEIDEEWIKENCYIAGGCCVSHATRSSINDVDIYFKTKKARDKFIEEAGGEKYISKEDELWKALNDYEELLKSNSIEFGDTKKYGKIEIKTGKINDIKCFLVDDMKISFEIFEKQKWLLENGYDYVLAERNHFEVENDTFLGNKSITIKMNDLTYQFILRFYGEPKQVMDETFDFQHCKIAYDLATDKYIASEETWECLSKREIKYVNSFYPVSSLKRLYKYASRGYKYSTNEFVKIIKDIRYVDTDNKFVLEDQVIGYYEDFDYNAVFINEQNWWE